MPDEELQGFGITDDDADIDATDSEGAEDNSVVSLDSLSEDEMEEDPDMDNFDDVDDF